jgi:cell division protein FtsW
MPRDQLGNNTTGQARYAMGMLFRRLRLPSPRAAGPALPLTAALLALFCALQAWSLLIAPAAWTPAAITVTLAPGGLATLGRNELAAPQADREHIAVRRDTSGAWWIRNLSATKQIVLQRSDDEERIGNAHLAAGQAFQVGAARFAVAAADTASVVFSRDGHQWRYDGAVLYRDGRALDACADTRWPARIVSLWDRFAPRALTVPHAMTFGGNVYCDNRLGLDGITPGAAWIARIDGRLELASGSPDGERAALLLAQAGTVGGGDIDLRRQEQTLAGVAAIVVGHTRFQLETAGDRLTLAPSRHVTLFSAPELRLPAAIAWTWQQRRLWGGDGQYAAWAGLALTATALLASLALPRASRWAWRCGALAAAALLFTGITSVLLQRAGHGPGAACSMLIGAAALWAWLLLPGRLSLATAAGIVLLGIGLLAQLEMGLGGMESSWLRYYQKSASLLAIGCGAGGLWRLRAIGGRGLPAQRTIERGLLALATLALAAMAAEVLWGDETGVFDLQPVELAKLALTALTAHCLALRLGWLDAGRSQARPWARWPHLIAPVLLFLALTAAALVQVDDYSPLILLLVWSTGMAFAYALATGNRALGAALVGLVLAAVGAIVYLRWVGTDDLIQWGFYADRFLVWLDPAEHPHTGQQLLLGARAIGDGGWWGAGHFLGLNTLGQPAGAVLRIPAVQDDFSPAFFLNRHGLAGGLLLWAVQAAFVVGLVQAAMGAWSAAGRAGDFRLAWLARFRYFALCGGAAFVLGHFLLSWGTNLAIFPIMGQPMSFLSAGGSHLLFFLCPLLALCAASEGQHRPAAVF